MQVPSIEVGDSVGRPGDQRKGGTRLHSSVAGRPRARCQRGRGPRQGSLGRQVV